MKFTLIIDPAKEEEVTMTVHEPCALSAQIEQLVRGSDRIAAYLEEEIRLLSFSEIACITVLDGKTCAIDEHGTQYRLRQRLYEVEALVPPYFIRINKSALANERQLERFRAGFSGAVNAVFRSGFEEYVSRRCFAQIKRRFQL